MKNKIYWIICVLLIIVIVIVTIFILGNSNDEKVLKNNNEVNVKEKITDKIDWEEYPNDINEKVFKNFYGIKDDKTTISNYNESVSYQLMRKTIYSLSQNYNLEKDSFEQFYNLLGDSTKIVETDSNYARYCYPDNENNNLSAKYEEKIEYSIASFNELYYDGYYNLETSTKRQYEKLIKENSSEKFYYEIARFLIMNGNNENKEEYKNNARAKKIKLTINDKEYVFELKDTNKVQVFDLNYKQEDIKSPVKVKVEVLEKYDGEKTSDVYISDFQCDINSNIPQGR